MKKALMVVSMLVLTIFLVFAYQNIYNAYSIEYRILMALSKMSETELPNPTSGISGDQMSPWLMPWILTGWSKRSPGF